MRIPLVSSSFPVLATALLLMAPGVHAAGPAVAAHTPAQLQALQAAQLAALTQATPAAAPTVVALAAPAAPVASVGSEQDLASASKHFLDEAVAQLPQQMAGTSLPLRMEVSLGALDSRLRLAPCARVEPYLPPGMRLWGKSRLGLRCVEGQVRWNVFLPVTVKAFGPAWVVQGPVAPGTTLSAGDAVEGEVDWAEDMSPVVADPAQWIGSTVTRNLAPGQALRQSMVRPPQAFGAGTQVRVVAQGPGFAVTSDGQAMTAGFIGQQVRIRMENGRIMSGTVLDERTVQLAL
ncbi:flagellar basal body P-ring formation chaperone FlgA [Xylophilus sp. GW821-FHT01B05]